MKKIMLLIILTLPALSSYALNPKKDYAVSPADYGMTFDEISIPTEDNLTLYGWFFKATVSNSFKVIILSDDGDGNMADLIEIASNFLALGYNVITYDYRGYGKSSEFNINTNFFIYSQFEKDLKGVLGYVKKYHSTLRTVHLYGCGIGAGLSLGVGANNSEVGKIIADSPYNNFENMKKVIKEVSGVDALFPLGYNKNIMEPTYALEAKGGTLSGILFIAGETETIFTSKIARELAKIRSGISSVYIAKGATASTTFSSNKAKYFEEIKNFLK